MLQLVVCCGSLNRRSKITQGHVEVITSICLLAWKECIIIWHSSFFFNFNTTFVAQLKERYQSSRWWSRKNISGRRLRDMFTVAPVLGPIYLEMLSDNGWINKHACQGGYIRAFIRRFTGQMTFRSTGQSRLIFFSRVTFKKKKKEREKSIKFYTFNHFKRNGRHTVFTFCKPCHRLYTFKQYICIKMQLLN